MAEAKRVKRFHRTEIERENIEKNIAEILRRRDEIIFACLHGSFLSMEGFKDIDIAVYVADSLLRNEDVFEYEVALSLEISESIHYPVDVKVLNSSATGFKYEAVRGKPLVIKDEEIHSSFLEDTWFTYLDREFYRKEYLISLMAG